jgi:putative ABC transport system permease protein
VNALRWAFVLHTALRGLRGARRRLAFVVLCVAAGVASLVAVESFGSLLDRAVRSEARRLLAADLELAGRRPLTADERAQAGRVLPAGSRTLAVVELVTMATAPARRPDTPPLTRLVELRAIEPGYPFYGRLVTDPPDAVGRVVREPVAAVHPELLGQLGLAIGDTLAIGRARFTVAGVITDEPDRSVQAFSAGPRVVVGGAFLDATELVQPGSRVRYRTLVRLPDAAAPADARAVARRVADALPSPEIRVESFDDAQPALRRFLGRLGDYLGLLSLATVVLAGVGVGSQVAVHVARQIDAVAVLRCLGATGREIVAVFVVQAGLLGLGGGLLGAAAGTLAQLALPGLLAGFLPIDVRFGVSWAAVLRGVALGVAMSTLFAWLPLLRVARIPALRVLRRGLEAPERRLSRGRLAAAAAVLTALFGAAWIESGSPRVAGVFVGGLAGTVGLLWGIAALLVLGLRRRQAGLGFALRHGIASLRRPGNQTVAAVVALGSGVALLVTLAVIEGAFAQEVRSARRADMPSLFLVDIQPRQADAVRQLLAEVGAQTREAPLVTARLRTVDGEPVQSRPAARYTGDRERDADQWRRTREYRLSYSAELPEGNEIVAGEWWGADTRALGGAGAMPGGDEPAPVSMEVEYAERLGVGLGSRLEFDVQGVRLPTVVTSLRRVRWETMTPNFFVMLPPGWLEAAPQQRIAAVRLPAEVDRGAVQGLVVSRFPNVTIIDISRLVEKVAAVLERVAFAVRFMALFCLAAGLAVLAGAIAGTAQERAREASLLKVLGADRRRVAGVLLVEFAALGGIAGLAGATAAAGLSWAVLDVVLELAWPWALGPWPFAAGAAIAVVLTAVGGLASAYRLLGRRPLELLREA